MATRRSFCQSEQQGFVPVWRLLQLEQRAGAAVHCSDLCPSLQPSHLAVPLKLVVTCPVSATLCRPEVANSRGAAACLQPRRRWCKYCKLHHHHTTALPRHFSDRHIGVNFGHYLGRSDLWAVTRDAFDGMVGSYGYTACLLCCHKERKALSVLGITGNV